MAGTWSRDVLGDLGLQIQVIQAGVQREGSFVKYVGGNFTNKLRLLLLWKYTFIQPSKLDCNKIRPAVKK